METEFTNVIRELTAEAKVLEGKVRSIDEPPSPDQLGAVQKAINEMQRKLNRLQTALDACSEQTEM